MRFATITDGGVAIAIAGAAIGLSAADLCVAPEPFGRAGDIESRCSQQGTGLGLSLARAGRPHGGELTLKQRTRSREHRTMTRPCHAVCAPCRHAGPGAGCLSLRLE